MYWIIQFSLPRWLNTALRSSSRLSINVFRFEPKPDAESGLLCSVYDDMRCQWKLLHGWVTLSHICLCYFFCCLHSSAITLFYITSEWLLLVSLLHWNHTFVVTSSWDSERAWACISFERKTTILMSTHITPQAKKTSFLPPQNINIIPLAETAI